MKKKRVLRVRANEFLYRLYDNRMETTGHIKHAMDIRDLDWNVIVNIMENLRKQGYVEATIIESN